MGHKTCLPVFLFVSLMCFFLFHFWGVGSLGFVAGLGFFPARGAASSWLDSTRQQGRGMPAGSSDLTCLARLTGFNL